MIHAIGIQEKSMKTSTCINTTKPCEQYQIIAQQNFSAKIIATIIYKFETHALD